MAAAFAAMLAAAAAAAAAASPGPAVSAAGPAVSAARGAPRVEMMVVGRSRTLLDATNVGAPTARVAVARRRCSVAAATPLAALVAAGHAAGLKVVLRDYGHCGPATRDAASLFVTQIAQDRNSGHDGWVYKVDGRAGTTGAADPSGPFGDGRALRSGQRLLWFWCNAGPGQHCQRSLEVQVPATLVRRGGTVAIRVLAVDDNGKALAMANATVTLAGARATTAAGGAASLPAPGAPGRYEIRATAPGLVPSFPAAVRVS
jgi:hypothetical protein